MHTLMQLASTRREPEVEIALVPALLPIFNYPRVIHRKIGITVTHNLQHIAKHMPIIDR